MDKKEEMNEIANSFVESTAQCWGCPIFDRLFQIISYAAAAVYDKFAIFCVIIFCVLFAFYIINAFWKNMKDGISDPFYQKSIKPVFINSIVALALLSMGVMFPRFITSITFEPVADLTLIYTQSMLKTDNSVVNEKVTYQPETINDEGFYRPQLRDKIIMLMKTTITQFQAYMKLGIAIMDKAFSLKALLGIGSLIKHILLFVIGLYLTYGFFKFFLYFCFYFADVIIAMTFFAFFFPLSLILISFKGGNAPNWILSLGKNVGTNQFKNLINSIVTLASAVITYTVIMVILAKFFSAQGQSAAEIMELITTGQIFADDLSTDNLAAMTIGSCIILVYVLNFIYSQIPQVTSMIMDSFGVSTKNDLSEQLAKDAMKLTSNVINTAVSIGKNILSGGETKDKKEGDKKEGDKKAEKK